MDSEATNEPLYAQLSSLTPAEQAVLDEALSGLPARGRREGQTVSTLWTGLKLLGANPGRLIVLVAGSVSVALAASALLIASTSSLAVVQQQLNAGWRGPYDILVRPADTEASAGGRVPANYVSVRGSGISRAEWDAIQAIPGVEVAAPVASLGWMTDGGPPVSVELQDVAAETVYLVDVQVSVGGERVVSHVGAFARPPEAGPWPLSVGLGTTVDFGNGDLNLDLAQLPSTWGLVVGIDPIAEDQLIGLDRFVSGRALTRGVSQVFDQQAQREAVGVPIVTAAHSEVPGTLQVSVLRLEGVAPEVVQAALDAIPPPADSEAVEAYLAEQQRVLRQLTEDAATTQIAADAAPLDELLTPLREPRLALTASGNLTADASSFGGAWGIERSVVLVPKPAPYTHSGDDRLRLQPVGTWDALILPQLERLAAADYTLGQANLANGRDEPIYRPLDVATPPPFSLQPLGTVDLGAIAAEYETATSYAPLGIYGEAPRHLVATAGGQPTDKLLPASLNPAGINPLPPIGLTNLEAVEALRGERFIDAIRVRVAGISGYDPGAISRVEDVAQAILQRTGLRVDVVAGAAASDVEVEVPDLGVISERWTTLGEAPRIESGAAGLSGVLLAGGVAVALAYLVTFALVLVEDQAPELSTLRLIGWRRRTVLALLAGQALIVGLGAGIIAVTAYAVLAPADGSTLRWLTYGLLLGAVLGAHLLAIAAVGTLATRPLASALRGRSVDGGRRAVSSIRGLAISQALESRLQFVGTAIALVAAVTLAGFVATVELVFNGALRGTLLGQQVALRIAPYHLLGAAAALFAAGAVVLDNALLTVERRIATLGLLRALGWRAGPVRRLVFAEAVLPALCAAVLGAVFIGGLGLALGLGIVSLAVAGVAALVAVTVGWLATRPALGLVARVSPATSLRAEGASTVLPGLAVRQAMLTVGLLAVAVLAGSVGWSQFAPIGIAASEITTSPPPTPQPADVQRLASDVAAISRHSGRMIGSEALTDSFASVAERLRELGYDVREVGYLARVLDVRDETGESIRIDGAAWPVSLAYRSSRWTGSDLVSAFVALEAPAGVLPPCSGEVVVLRLPDEASAPLATQLLERCAETTAAVLGVVADDQAWRQLALAATLRLPAAEQVIATTPGANGAPWLVAGLDTAGPGATASAASVAVVLEVARKAVANDIPVNVAVATTQAGGSISILLREIAQLPGPIIILGPMGGQVSPMLGTTEFNDLDAGATCAGLLSSVEVDDAGGWLARCEELQARPTSSGLLELLSHSLSVEASTELSANAYALALGLDAAYLGEPLNPQEGITSVAGTSVDTPEQTDPRELAAIARGLLATIGELGK